jgi:hypothetical protein
MFLSVNETPAPLFSLANLSLRVYREQLASS